MLKNCFSQSIALWKTLCCFSPRRQACRAHCGNGPREQLCVNTVELLCKVFNRTDGVMPVVNQEFLMSPDTQGRRILIENCGVVAQQRKIDRLIPGSEYQETVRKGGIFRSESYLLFRFIDNFVMYCEPITEIFSI